MRTTLFMAFAAAVMLIGAQPVMAQSGHDLFQQALVKERANGQLREAIALYERIVDEFSADRTLTASSLVRMAQCYEKLGLGDAQRIYRRVIDEFPEQREEVALARERLASLSRELAELNRGPTFRKIEIASKPRSGVLSQDGTKLAFVSDGSVWVMPLHGYVDPTIAGEPVRIADLESVWDNFSLLTWSADGQWIAVNAPPRKRLAYVIPARGGEPQVVPMPDRGNHAYSYRLSLSPHGETLAFSALGTDQEEGPNDTEKRFIYTVPVAGGQPRQLTEMWGRLPAFSPDGQTIAYVSDRRKWEGGDWESDLWLVPASGGQPERVTSSVSGRMRGPVWSPDGRYIAAHHEPGGNNDSRELWIIPVAAARTASSLTKIQLPMNSGNMLAGWTPDNRLGVFMRARDNNGAAYTVPASGGPAVQVTPESIRPDYLGWSPDGKRIYVQWYSDVGERVLGSIPAEGGEVSEVKVPWGRDLMPGVGLSVSPDGRMVAFMGIQHQGPLRGTPEADAVGIWTVSVDGGALTRLTLGPTYDAYPCWSPDGRWIAFLRLDVDSGVANIHLIPSAGGETRQVTSDADRVAVMTIAFSPEGDRIAFFSDGAIRSVLVRGGESAVVVETGAWDRSSGLSWSPDGRQIAYNLDGKIWVALLGEGRAVELSTGLSVLAQHSYVTWSPDGEKIAFVASRTREPEFWLISDFLP
jgi:Tol biopolymer transport system component